MFLGVQLLSENAVLPCRATEGSVGYDLFSPVSWTIEPGGSGLIPLNLCVAIPQGCYGRIAPRSGLAWKKLLDVLGGVIDTDFKDEVRVILINHGVEPVQIEKGDKIAQLILEKCETPPVVQMENLFNTSRGGFGSTGR